MTEEDKKGIEQKQDVSIADDDGKGTRTNGDDFFVGDIDETTTEEVISPDEDRDVNKVGQKADDKEVDNERSMSSSSNHADLHDNDKLEDDDEEESPRQEEEQDLSQDNEEVQQQKKEHSDPPEEEAVVAKEEDEEEEDPTTTINKLNTTTMETDDEDFSDPEDPSQEKQRPAQGKNATHDVETPDNNRAAVLPPPTKEEAEEESNKSKIWMILLAVVFVIAIVIVVVVVATKAEETPVATSAPTATDGPTDVPSFAPTQGPTTSPSSSPSQAPTTIFDLAKFILSDSGISSVESFDDPSSAQSMALDWIVYNDTETFSEIMPLNAGAVPGQRLPKPKFVIRYIMAVFFYSLSGPEWQAWQFTDEENNSSWLNSESDECQWEFIVCDESTGWISGIQNVNGNYDFEGTIPSELQHLDGLSKLISMFCSFVEMICCGGKVKITLQRQNPN